MARYSSERKEAVLKKLLPPHNMTVMEVARSEGISYQTLYHWRDKAKKEGRPAPGKKLTSKHKHSKLNFVSPSERHAMQDRTILSKRKIVLEEAGSRNPKCWPNGIRNCDAVGEVTLNPDKQSETETRNAA
jgi:transposase-like protein